MTSTSPTSNQSTGSQPTNPPPGSTSMSTSNQSAGSQPTGSPPFSGSTNVGAVVGGIVSGLFILIAVVVLVYLWRRYLPRRKTRLQVEASLRDSEWFSPSEPLFTRARAGSEVSKNHSISSGSDGQSWAVIPSSIASSPPSYHRSQEAIVDVAQENISTSENETLPAYS